MTTPLRPASSESANDAQSTRSFSFQRIATAMLSLIGFVGLVNGLTHMMNGSWPFALALSFIVQGLAVVAIHRYKRARDTGGAFRYLRGGSWLSLYIVLVFVIVTFSYSFYFRLMRAERAASEIYTAQVQTLFSSMTTVASKYGALSSGFQNLADAAESRAKDEQASGNTCKVASPKGAGPIRNFRAQDAAAFRDYANMVARNAREIEERMASLRAQTFRQGAVRETESALNQIVSQVNASSIGNPMLSGIVQFIDGRLIAGDRIDYFGKVIKCDDEQRTSQLIALKLAAQAISKEPPLPAIALFDPGSVQENALIAANRLAALVDVATSLGRKDLKELDPSVKRSRLSTGGHVYISEDYLPLIFAAVIEILLFMAVPAPIRDIHRREIVNGIFQGSVPISIRTLCRTLWLSASVPVDDGLLGDVDELKPLRLKAKFIVLRPYLHSFRSTHYLLIPHAAHTAHIQDFADALMLMRHAREVAHERFAVGALPLRSWTESLQRTLAPHYGLPDWDWDMPLPPHTLAAINQIPVRCFIVSRAFFAWMIARAVEMEEHELNPPPAARKHAAKVAAV